MLDERPTECGANQDLLNGIVKEMRRLADQLDAIAVAGQARMTEYLSALNPRPGAKPDGFTFRPQRNPPAADLIMTGRATSHKRLPLQEQSREEMN